MARARAEDIGSVGTRDGRGSYRLRRTDADVLCLGTLPGARLRLSGQSGPRAIPAAGQLASRMAYPHWVFRDRLAAAI